MCLSNLISSYCWLILRYSSTCDNVTVVACSQLLYTRLYFTFRCSIFALRADLCYLTVHSYLLWNVIFTQLSVDTFNYTYFVHVEMVRLVDVATLLLLLFFIINKCNILCLLMHIERKIPHTFMWKILQNKPVKTVCMERILCHSSKVPWWNCRIFKCFACHWIWLKIKQFHQYKRRCYGNHFVKPSTACDVNLSLSLSKWAEEAMQRFHLTYRTDTFVLLTYLCTHFCYWLYFLHPCSVAYCLVFFYTKSRVYVVVNPLMFKAIWLSDHPDLGNI